MEGEPSMSDFNRRLPKRSWDRLQELASARIGWWPDLLECWAPSGHAGTLRLAIRNGYMNFYAAGQSVAKISFGRGGASPTMSIHEKYVKKCPGSGQNYVKLPCDEGADADGRPAPWGGRTMLDTWIARTRCYTSEEKCCVDKLVAVSPKVIDLEMGLPAVGKRKSALRMDMVALEGSPDDLRLVFWEAKLIGDSRLRSRKHEPEVFKQICGYRSYLADADRRQRVTEAYRECCRAIRGLHAMASQVREAHCLDPLVLAAAEPDSALALEDNPRLVIFDDGKKCNNEAWKEHLDVLRCEVPVAIVKTNAIFEPIEEIGTSP